MRGEDKSIDDTLAKHIVANDIFHADSLDRKNLKAAIQKLILEAKIEELEKFKDDSYNPWTDRIDVEKDPATQIEIALTYYSEIKARLKALEQESEENK